MPTYTDIVLDTPITPGQKVPGLSDGTRPLPVGAVGYITNLLTGPPYTWQDVDASHGLPVVGQTGYTFPVSGPLTDAQLRASAVPVSGTFWQATQPVSGTVTANVGTTNGLALDATLTGGTQQARVTDGTNVATVKAASTAAGAADKALVVAVSPNNSVAVTGTFWQATQPVSGTVTANIGTGNLAGITGTVTVDSELPAAATFADGTTNPTAPAVGGFLHGFNGTTWDRAPGNTSGLFAQGNVANDGVDAGSPVKVGGKANSSTPTAVSVGDRADLWVGLNGQAMVATMGAPQGDASGQVGGFLNASGTGQIGTVAQYLFDGSSSWNRQRGNHEVTALASAARTAAVNSADLGNFNARGVAVVIDITAGGGAGSLTVKLTGKDTLSGKYITLFSTGALAAPGVSTYSFQVFPGATPVAQVSGTPATVGKADFLVPRVWRIEVTVGDTTSYTYSVGVNYLN